MKVTTEALLQQLERAIPEFKDTKKDLSNYIITGKYSNYLDEENRRETWDEAVSRVELMHLKKFDFLNSADLMAIIKAFKLVRDKKVAPSMRSLQFGGVAVEAHNARQYNCAVRHVDSIRSFSEIFYLLLCGAGVGLGLSDKFLGRLPNLVSEPNRTGIVTTYVVEDTIEGWSDAVEALLSCYFVNTAWTGRKIVFDFSRIRPAGSILKTSGGRAPGYRGLKAALSKIKSLLDRIIEVNHQQRLRTIDAYDINMHMSDAVLSGGIRRCLPEGTLVKTDQGAVKIEDMLPGYMVETPMGIKEVKNVFYQGEQELVKIVHPFGEFECTPNHKMAVFTDTSSWEFKRAKDLTTDDRLVWDSEIWAGTDQALPLLNMHRALDPLYSRNNGRTNKGDRYPGLACSVEDCDRAVAGKSRVGPFCSPHLQRFYKYGNPLMFRGWAKDVTLPECVTDDFAWLTGLIQGDGYNYKEDGWASSLEDVKGKVEIAFHSDQTESAERARSILQDICPDTEVRVKQARDENCVKVSLYNARFVQWLRQNVKLPNVSMSVPEWVLKSPSSVRASYLAGLFDADGSASNRRNMDAVCSVYPEFLRQVRMLCATLGFLPTLRTVRPAAGNWQALYKLSIVGYEFKDSFIEAMSTGDSRTIDASKLGGGADRRGGKELINFDRGMETSAVRVLDRTTTVLPIPVLDVIPSVAKETYDIEVEDIHQFTADGFVTHNSAMSVMFHKDDELMMNAKTGNWFEENPQRGRSNNSVLLVRGEVTIEEFTDIVNITKEWGEPGFVFADTEDVLFNPCQPAWAPVLTPNGISTMGDIKEGESIWSETGWTTVTKKWSTGIKSVYRYSTTAGSFYGTENHRIVSSGEKVEVKDAESIDILRGSPSWIDYDLLDPKDIAAGLVIGDGTLNNKHGKNVMLVIGENDSDYFDSEVSDLIGKKRADFCFDIESDIEPSEVPVLPQRTIPNRYYMGSSQVVAGFLRGIYSANGSVVDDRVTLKTSSWQIRDRVQLMLSSLGIGSYYTTNKSKDVEFDNGTYNCKESYDVNITSDRALFMKHVGFIQEYKTEKLDKAASLIQRVSSGKKTFDVIGIEYIGDEEVFDITVDNEPHTYWTGGVNVSNCFEIAFLPVTEDGVCGVQMCNLTTINGGKVQTREDFIEYAKAAALIGTLQAAYADFPYLSNAATKLTEQEALLGVSITAMMESPEVILDPEAQQEASAAVVETNKIWAQKIGINQAARCTAIKPEGTSTLAYESMFSGIHAAHSKFMFRRVQANKLEPVYQHFKKYNAHATKASVYSANQTDDAITFPVYNPDGLVKADFDAIAHLEIIKSTQQNWVVPGTTEANRKPVHHNVSSTVIVDDHEWGDVAEYLFDNRESFAAVSLLAKTGDKDYAQAPMEEVTTQEDVNKFLELMDLWTMVDYTLLREEEDVTSVSQEAACAGGSCEIIYT